MEHHCKGCSKVFKLKKSFHHHLTTTKCGSKPKKEYECEQCTYTTLIKNSFTRHISSCKYVYAVQQKEELEKEKEGLYNENHVLLKTIEKKDEEIQRLTKEKEQEVNLKIEKIKLFRKKIKDLEVKNLRYRLQLEEKKGRIIVYEECPTTVNYINHDG